MCGYFYGYNCVLHIRKKFGKTFLRLSRSTEVYKGTQRCCMLKSMDTNVGVGDCTGPVGTGTGGSGKGKGGRK